MKKWILFLMFILAVQIGYKIAPVLGQNEQDAQEIKNVIDKLANSMTYQDLDSAMSQVSMNYSCATCGEAKDYNTFKSILQERMNDVLKIYTDYSISELRLNNLNIQDNNATVEIEYSWKGFNLDTLKEDSGKVQRSATLAKEDGFWKITQWRRFLAQDNKDVLEIKKVVEAFLEDFISDDLDSAMQWVSINYSDRRGDNVIDYGKFKSGLEERRDIVFYKRIDYSIIDLQLDNLEIKDNKATLEVEWYWQGFNLVTREWDTGIARRQAALAKEKGIWKITQWRILE